MIAAGEGADAMTTVAQRLEHVRLRCGFATRLDYIAALDITLTTLDNWGRTGSIQRGNRDKLREITGVDPNWLLSGEGVPFPEGPLRAAAAIREDDAFLREPQTHGTSYGSLTLDIVRRIAATSTDAASGFSTAVWVIDHLLARLPPYESSHGHYRRTLQRLEERMREAIRAGAAPEAAAADVIARLELLDQVERGALAPQALLDRPFLGAAAPPNSDR